MENTEEYTVTLDYDFRDFKSIFDTKENPLKKKRRNACYQSNNCW